MELQPRKQQSMQCKKCGIITRSCYNETKQETKNETGMKNRQRWNHDQNKNKFKLKVRLKKGYRKRRTFN